MYKLLIADDNAIIRDALKKFIDWAGLGFSISGEAGNGVEALDQIRNNTPHAILLDIRMPVMSGLELMDILKSEKADIYVVILSAYDEFSYAKKALEVGAVDYILKPYNKEKIQEVFTRIKLEIDEKNRSRAYSEELSSIINDKLFNRIINNDLDKEHIDKMFEETGLRPDYENYALIFLYINKNIIYQGKAVKDPEQVKSCIRNIIIATFPDSVCFQVFLTGSGQLAVITGYNGSSDEIMICGREMISKINKDLEIGVKVLYKCDLKSLSEISLYYSQIYLMLRYRFYLKQNHMNGITTVSDGTETPPVLIRDIPNKTAAYMSSGEYRKVLDYIESIFAAVKNGKRLSDEEVYTIYTGFLSGIQYFAEQMNIPVKELLDDKEISYDEFIKFDTLNDIQVKLQHIFKATIDNIEQYRDYKCNKVIETAKDYILNNYNRDICLNDIAKHVFMHPVYFCTIFKRETGESFNQYLTHIRLSKAFDLMKSTNMKIYEISSEVGYKSSKHFSRLFKEYYGIMPKEYKNKAVLK